MKTGKMVHGGNDPIALALMKLTGCPQHVRSIEYRAAIHEVSMVTVEFFPEIDASSVASDLMPIVRRFRLQTSWEGAIDVMANEALGEIHQMAVKAKRELQSALRPV